jgi:transaldolase
VTDPTPGPLRDLQAAGVSVWLDDLSRDRLQSGNLADLVASRGVVGVTTNPTIFHAAITASDTYRDDLAALAASGADAEAAVRDLTVADVQHACDLLAGVAEASSGVDGRVSLEVDPRLAHDGGATLVAARELWQAVDRPNLMIKIPATLAGLPAVAACLAEGISVNVTLIFSLERYRAVLEAWLDGLERRLAAGRPLADVASVASFFVSRVDTEVDARLDALGVPPSAGLHGRAALANARLAYQAYEQVRASPRWAALAAAGARPQRPLWASTGVKNPAYPDTLYVTELVAPDTVNTMPQATLDAVADHGVVRLGSVVEEYARARATVDALAAAGVDLDDVTALLEQQGVQKFATSWGDLLAAVEARLQQMAAPAQAAPARAAR